MAAITSTPLVSVDEYIARFVDAGEKPTCEYEDGMLIPKPMGTKKHSQVQVNVAMLLRINYGKTLNPLTELTTRLREGRFLVPDIAVEEMAKPIPGRYPGKDDPVLLCVEIVSPPDRIGKLFGKCEEYHKWGVPYCWVIDPEHKIAWEYFPNDIEPRKVEDNLTAGPIVLALSDVYFRV
jgi:Uma2 family endonuclease